jgi:predicted hotdog family 3-hydroxylacyl-ACP dehydratase
MGREWSPVDVLPHRPPMVLLSRIIAWDNDSLVGEVDVTAASPFVEQGLGVPRWVGLEYMAQAVGALDGIRLREAGRPVPPGYLLGTRRLDGTDGYFAEGAKLRITVQEVLQDENGLGAYSCRLDDGERSLACQLTVYRPPASGGNNGAREQR